MKKSECLDRRNPRGADGEQTIRPLMMTRAGMTAACRLSSQTPCRQRLGSEG